MDIDNVKTELACIRDNGRQLWCSGKESVAILDADDTPVPKKKKDEQKVIALEQKEKQAPTHHHAAGTIWNNEKRKKILRPVRTWVQLLMHLATWLRKY